VAPRPSDPNRWWLRLAGGVILTLAMATSSPALAADPTPISIGVLKLASSGPVFVAHEKGYFAEEGLADTLKFFEAAQPVALATVSGDLDFGATGLTAGFYNLAGKGALKIIAASAREEPGYKLTAYLASNRAYAAGLTAPGGLKGRSIAITQTGSTFHYMLGLVASKYGFDIAQNRLVPLQSLPNMSSALAGNQVDAALMPSTVALPMVGRGEAKLIGWVSDETSWQVTAVFAGSRTIQNRRAVVERFVRAYQKGARAYYDTLLAQASDGKIAEGPEAAAMIAILAKYTDQTPEQIKLGIPYIDPAARLMVQDIYNQVAWYQSQGLVDKGPTGKDVVDLSFIPGQGE
jgi:NitT/TauT family transport system substrate-binding protein